jgi:hypothetical protein
VQGQGFAAGAQQQHPVEAVDLGLGFEIAQQARQVAVAEVLAQPLGALGVADSSRAEALSSSTWATIDEGIAKVRPPARTSRAWVTARVRGRWMRKVVPWPGSVATLMRPPTAAVSLFTTSMPTPRPARLDRLAVLKPGTKMRLVRRLSSASSSAPIRPLVDGLGADAGEVEAGAVVAELDDDVVAFVGDLEGDLADLGLAGGAADFGRLDAVGDGVAHQVAEGRGHRLEHAAVDFDLAADDVEVGAPAELLGGLADQAVEALGEAVEGHHAHVHQRLLELAGHARLGVEGHFGAVEVLEQVLLHGGHVADALGHHPGELLEARVAVHLQGVELGVMGLDLREARLHLGVGLDLDFAQLVAQADDVFGEVEQGAAQGAQFALDAGAGDADLAGFVDELVDAAGFDPQLGAGGLGGDVAGLGRAASSMDRGFDAGGGRAGWAASGMPGCRGSGGSGRGRFRARR